MTWSQNHVATELHDEVVMMGVESGRYYSLDPIGSAVWQRLDQPRTVGEVCDALGAEFEADRAVIEVDVLALLDELLAEGLIVLVEAPEPPR